MDVYLSPLIIKYFTKKKSKSNLIQEKKKNLILFKKKSEKPVFIFEPKEKIICVINKTIATISFSVVCEKSVVYNYFSKVKKINYFLDKNINHVSFNGFEQIPIFSSLYNINKEDDKIYFFYDEDEIEELKIDLIPPNTRVINISFCSSGFFVHLGLIFFFFFFLLFFFFIFKIVEDSFLVEVMFIGVWDGAMMIKNLDLLVKKFSKTKK
jgi:hypothetical protein